MESSNSELRPAGAGLRCLSMGFRVWGLGVQGWGLRVWGFRVYGLGG